MEYCEKCGWVKQQCQCKKPMTNADRIRSMSDEELFEFLRRSEGCPVPIECLSLVISCDDCLRNWLKEKIDID